jgi:23S rRNA pseudouridine1911/1915/1917 synthase
MAIVPDGRKAVTHYEVIERFGSRAGRSGPEAIASLIECRLETGRTHQIRVHLQHIRHPLVGDNVYRRGTRHGLPFARQALHAAELTLTHPRSRQVMTWRAPLPRDLKKLLQELREKA